MIVVKCQLFYSLICFLIMIYNFYNIGYLFNFRYKSYTACSVLEKFITVILFMLSLSTAFSQI